MAASYIAPGIGGGLNRPSHSGCGCLSPILVFSLISYASYPRHCMMGEHFPKEQPGLSPGATRSFKHGVALVGERGA